MLTPSRSLSLHAESGRELPYVAELGALYSRGFKPRHGQVIMVAGRSGTQKSGFVLWWTLQMRLPTLYFSADMSAFTASSRVASSVSGDPTETVEARMGTQDGQAYYRDRLSEIPLQFSFGSPISWRSVDEEIQAYIELWDRYPEVMVFDNLMDFENAETDYTEQMQVMSSLTELARETGSTIIVLHHASDKTWEAKTDPWSPPSRDQIKNGLAEKPEICLSVALDPTTLDYNVAVVKNRMGPQDPTGRQYAILRCEPAVTRFHEKRYDRYVISAGDE